MTILALTESEQLQLIKAANKALEKAYAPYSRFLVGAAVLTNAGKIFAGCNIENASYGLSVCAERNAIANAIIEEGGGTMKIRAIAVTNSQNAPCSPCGSCRQVIWEFGQQAQIIFQGSEGWRHSNITELLPEGFSF